MSRKGRTSFCMEGTHPMLPAAMYSLIHKGFVLVDTDESPDFMLAGVDATPKNIPTVVLSSDIVYSDRDQDTKVREKGKMKEEDPLIITSIYEPSADKILATLRGEHNFACGNKQTMILRCFDVYGRHVNTGVIAELFKAALSQQALSTANPGYQVRTFLYEDDFLFIFEKMVDRFLNGAIGVYNVGSEEEISLMRLLESINQITGNPTEIQLVPSPRAFRWWVSPDMTRTKALTKWRPSKSLRSGLWEIYNKGYQQ